MSEPSGGKAKAKGAAKKSDKEQTVETPKPEVTASTPESAETPQVASPSGAHMEATGGKPEAVKAEPAAAEPVAKPAPAATAVAEKPAAAEAPAEKPEPPFTVDDLLSCTARFTHKAWHLFYSNQKDMEFIRNTPVRAMLEARTAAGAEELHKILSEAGVTEISRTDKTISMTATFEAIQKVIRLPQSYRLDVTRL